jgi:hypothetical protein
MMVFFWRWSSEAEASSFIIPISSQYQIYWKMVSHDSTSFLHSNIPTLMVIFVFKIAFSKQSFHSTLLLDLDSFGVQGLWTSRICRVWMGVGCYFPAQSVNWNKISTISISSFYFLQER